MENEISGEELGESHSRNELSSTSNPYQYISLPLTHLTQNIQIAFKA